MTVVGIEETAALAAVALIGYIFGQRTHKIIARALANRRQRELERATRIAWQLETIADSLRQELATHHSQIAGFKRRLRQAQEVGTEKSWELLCEEAESILGPTMQLAQQLAHAYDEIRQQSEALEVFTKGRTDPLTGVGNSRALEQQMTTLLKSAERGAGGFAVALVSMDRKPAVPGAPTSREFIEILPKLAAIIRTCMRDTDYVARYGDEEFVVVMPKTSLAGANVFGDRVRKRVQEQLSATVCCGMAEYQAGDESKSLLGRADSAFYSAKAAGPSRQFFHTGTTIREHVSKMAPIVAVAEKERAPAEVRVAAEAEPAAMSSNKPAEPAAKADAKAPCVAEPVA